MSDRDVPSVDFDLALLHAADVDRLARRASADPSGAVCEELDAAFLDALAELPFGVPFTFVEQYAGALVHDVRPASGHEAEQSSRGRVALGFHTDDSFLDPSARPEHLALLGVSNPERVPTHAVRVDDVVAQLERETIERLGRPSFRFACPASFEVSDGFDARVPPRPILRTRPDGRTEVSFAPSTVVVDDDDAEHHLALFREALDRAPRSTFVLDAGEILFVSNARCLHGRPPVVDVDRWIKRVYLRSDLSMLDRVAATGSPGVYAAKKAI
jgi:hypothetical protein